MRRETLLWAHFEPLHAVTYFVPETFAAFAEAGLDGFWRTYFAGRAAPLGAAGPEVVLATFYGFAPHMVRRAFPDVWQRISPERALAARAQGARAALRRMAPDADWAAIAGTLERAVDAADLAGRVLGAANAGLPRPDDDAERAWLAATALRELRGDGHVAALVAYDLPPCDVNVLRAGDDVPREKSQPARGWTDEEWAAAAGRLRERGLLDADGRLTPAGVTLRQDVERATDAAAAGPWRSFSDGEVDAACALLKPVTAACLAEVPPQLPINVPRVA
ncbi:MAG TPA: hypothetical protein VF519_01130 [Mycobacteriales bacterium]|jgi:hypothetical protein